MATVIFQALITGAFSVTRQVIQLGYFPRVLKYATPASGKWADLYASGQLGPVVAIVLAVLLFRSSGNLAAAWYSR